MTEMVQSPGRVPEWTVQDRLRKAREWAGLEQHELAARIGIGKNTPGNYERGITKPKRPTIIAWAMATGVDSEWLLSGVVRHEGLEPPTRWLTLVPDLEAGAAS